VEPPGGIEVPGIAIEKPPPMAVEDEEPPGPVVKYMIGQESIVAVENHHPVEVVQDVEPRIIESEPPKRGRNPRIEIEVIRRGWIIGHYRRAIIAVIIVDDGRSDIALGRTR
jgi:hypothetical protein